MSSETRRRQLSTVLSEGDYVLFLGAGFSVEAGLPTWSSALRELSSKLEGISPAYAEGMRQDQEQNRFLEAAELFYLASLTPAERSTALKSVFGGEPKITSRLEAIRRQPRVGVVTTNYDATAQVVFAGGGERCVVFGESDGDLQAVRVCDERFLVRLHGRIEVPESIILARRHYDHLARRESYQYFFRWLMECHNVIFFGFSFDDPMLLALLERVAGATGGMFHRRAFALFPHAPSPTLGELLNRSSIVPITYDPSNGHEEGWNLLCPFEHRVQRPATPRGVVESRLRHRLGVILAKLRMRKDESTRRAVVAALVADCIRSDRDFSELDRKSAIERVRKELALPATQRRTIELAFDTLMSQGRLETLPNGSIQYSTVDDDEGSEALQTLVKGVVARARAYGCTLAPGFDYEEAIREVISRVLVSNSLQVAHSIIRRVPLDPEKVDRGVEGAIADLQSTSRRRLEPLHGSIREIFVAPNREEEELLDLLSSTAFTTSILLIDPSILHHAEELSKRQVFLDASILMPWMCEGHPASELYEKVVVGLTRFQPYVADYYLNEVVSHRRIAVQSFTEGGLSDREAFENYCRYHGVGSINAFLAGFSGMIASKHEMSFADYLDLVAPFDSERDAARFLQAKGVRVIPKANMAMGDKSQIGLAAASIRDGLAHAGKTPRNAIRIEHDAHMISFLRHGSKTRHPPLFVTADKTLLRCLSFAQYTDVLLNVVLPHQAAYLADLADLGRGTMRGLSRSLWRSHSSRLEHIRSYYRDRVLREYEPALVNSLDRIVDEVMKEVEYAEVDGSFDADHVGGDELRRIREFRALDQFEPKFHETMNRARRLAGLLDDDD